MPRAVSDRVAVLWTGTGTGTMTLGSPLTGYQGFPSALNGETVAYSIKHNSSSEAEAGFGTYTSASNTLSRVFRTYPTFAGAAVSFSVGDKTVRLSSIAVEEPTFQTTNPTVNDDITAGYLEGRSTWLNRTTSVWLMCERHQAGNAKWTPIGAGSAIAASVSVAFTPTKYTPSGANVEAHLVAVEGAIPPPVSQNQLVGRLIAGTGATVGFSDSALTEELTPASGDKLLGWVGGVLRKFDAALIPGLGGDVFDDVDDGADYSVTPFEVGLTGANRNEQRRFTGNQNHLLRFTLANLANGDYGWLIRGGTGTVTLVYNDIPLNNGTVSIGLKSKVKWTVHDGEVLIDGGTNEPVDFDGVSFLDAELRDHCETINALGNVSGALSVNYELGSDVTLTLTANATSLAITNPPTSGKAGWITFYVNHGTGPFTWAHPTGVKHDANTAPTLSAVASRRSVLTYVTLDGGSTWLSFLGGKDIPL